MINDNEAEKQSFEQMIGDLSNDITKELEKVGNQEQPADIELFGESKENPEGFVAIEPESIEVQEEDEEETKAKKSSYQKRKLANLQRDKARIAEEARQLARENEVLRSQYEQAIQKAQLSAEAAQAHYQHGINLREDQLRENLKKAHEMNDIDAVADYTARLGMLGGEADAARTRNAFYQSQYQQPQYQQPQYYPQQQEVQLPKEAHAWADRNPWLIEGNAEYDEDMRNEVLAHANTLEQRYRREGRGHLIGTDHYFNDLDRYAQDAFGDDLPQVVHKPKASQSNRNLEQSFSGNSRVPIAPVRKSASGNYGAPKNIQFSDADKEILPYFKDVYKKMGVTTEDFARAKLKSSEQYKKARETGNLPALRAWGLI